MLTDNQKKQIRLITEPMGYEDRERVALMSDAEAVALIDEHKERLVTLYTEEIASCNARIEAIQGEVVKLTEYKQIMEGENG